MRSRGESTSDALCSDGGSLVARRRTKAGKGWIGDSCRGTRGCPPAQPERCTRGRLPGYLGRGETADHQPGCPQNGLQGPVSPALARPRPPAHVTRSAPRAHPVATPGRGPHGGGPAPRWKWTNQWSGRAGRAVTANGGGAAPRSNRLVGGGKRCESLGTEGRARSCACSSAGARRASPERRPSLG